MATVVEVSNTTYQELQKKLNEKTIDVKDMVVFLDAKKVIEAEGWDAFEKKKTWDVRKHNLRAQQDYESFSFKLRKVGDQVSRAYCKVTKDNKVILTKVELVTIETSELVTK